MVRSGKALRGDREFISSATMSSKDKGFSRPWSTFSDFKSKGVTVSGGTAGVRPTCVYNIALIMYVVQSSERGLDHICKVSNE